MLRKRINALFNPELYHGWGRKSKFFEGWYFKLVNRAEDRILAIIPGVSMDKVGKKHSFIQVLDGINLKSEYTTFGFEDFYAINVSQSQLNVEMENKRCKLQINCTRPEATPLASPIFGEMTSHIHESMQATLELTLVSKERGSVVLSAIGRNCALEVAGNSDLLVP